MGIIVGLPGLVGGLLFKLIAGSCFMLVHLVEKLLSVPHVLYD